MATDSTKEEKRPYSMDDGEFVNRIIGIQAAFEENLSDFEAFDPDLNSTYSAQFAAKYVECASHFSDTTTVAQQQGFAEEVKANEEKCFELAGDVEYFAGKAFKKNKRILAEFGFSPHERKRARATTGGCLMWLVVMKRVCDFYATELAAVDMPATLPAQLLTAKGELEAAETEHEFSKRMRLRQTRLRIKGLNELYAYYDQVHRAADQVFAASEAKRKMFVL